MIALFSGVLGLIVGSFLNVAILRRGKRDLSGRSSCPSCGRQLRWLELVPVLSWIALAGRCRTCRARISLQYPLVELLTGALFALIAGALAPALAGASLLALMALAAYFAIASLLVAIALYDLRTTIIPDAWVYPFAALALSSSVFFPPYPASAPLPVLFAGPSAALPLFLLWFFSRGAWMGFGDVKLGVGIGWLLGPVSGLFAILFGFVIGGVIATPLLFFSSHLWRTFVARCIQPHFSIWGQLLSKSAAGFTMKSEIPFGPFLVASCLLIWFMQLYGAPLPWYGA